MAIPTTLPEQVEDMRDRDISYKTLHRTANLYDRKTDTTIKIPYESLSNKYKDYLSTIIISKELTEEERRKYWYKPKSLSNDIYGTTEFWDIFLILNYCTSISQFTPLVVKYYDPDEFKRFLNEILIIEKVYV